MISSLWNAIKIDIIRDTRIVLEKLDNKKFICVSHDQFFVYSRSILKMIQKIIFKNTHIYETKKLKQYLKKDGLRNEEIDVSRK